MRLLGLPHRATSSQFVIVLPDTRLKAFARSCPSPLITPD